MKRAAIRFGLIAGVLISASMGIRLIIGDWMGSSAGAIVAYAGILTGFSMVVFGVRSYRDTTLGGRIRFGQALSTGALISLIACSFYVLTWEYLYFGGKASDFEVHYSVAVLANAKASGATTEELDAKRVALDAFQRLYRNPLTNVAITFLEPLPLAVLVTLASAGWLSRKRGDLTADKDRIQN